MQFVVLVPTASVSDSAIMRRRDLGLASHADVLRGSSRVPVPRTWGSPLERLRGRLTWVEIGPDRQ